MTATCDAPWSASPPWWCTRWWRAGPRRRGPWLDGCGIQCTAADSRVQNGQSHVCLRVDVIGRAGRRAGGWAGGRLSWPAACADRADCTYRHAESAGLFRGVEEPRGVASTSRVSAGSLWAALTHAKATQPDAGAPSVAPLHDCMHACPNKHASIHAAQSYRMQAHLPRGHRLKGIILVVMKPPRPACRNLPRLTQVVDQKSARMHTADMHSDPQ